MRIKLVHHKYDIVIVGAGGAGLMAALRARQNGFSVAVLSKVHPTKSHTVAAQGGINAALGNIEPDDWQWHMYDTIKGSDWLADQDAVEYMCKNAAESVLNLAELGVAFSRTSDGKLYQRLYGGQSTEFGKGKLAYRACASSDQTGNAIITTLYNKTKDIKADFFSYHFVYDLILKDNQCIGVASWSVENGNIHIFSANQVIIATGGYGQIYSTTTAANICTGDGNALCAMAGIPLQDMEFVQFHPTALPKTGILISEAARAEGAHLVNALGERFMSKYSPQFQDLACRDVVARAIATEIAEGRGVENNHVWLCLKHLSKSLIKERLPNLFENTKEFLKLDPSKDLIPVAPAAHYTMGGIPTNIHGVVVPGLMAIGEAACVSVHGANRLGCNSLLDIIVFAESAIKYCSENIAPGQKKQDIDYDIFKIEDLLNKNGEFNPQDIKIELQLIMQENVGMFRTKKNLESSLKKLQDIINKQFIISDKSLIWNSELLEALETKNLAIQALITCYAALKREESRGAHFRVDFPVRDDENWLKHSLVYMDQDFNLTYKTKAVQFTPLTVDSIKLEERKY
ncbi:MAG: succinate dehydrogenase flavoprotein subunit [Pseudomonadota bacterium]